LKLQGLGAYKGIPESPPARGRGLKRSHRQARRGPGQVAPRTGAWIETIVAATRPVILVSPPARGRGLKLVARRPANGQN